MKLTVFGAGGLLGRRLVAQAVDRGHEVTAAVRSTAPNSRFPDAATVIQVDVYDGRNVETALAESEIVYNALSHTKSTPTDHLTVCGRNILDAMESAGVERYLTAVPATIRRDGEQHGVVESLAVPVLRLLRPTVTADAAAHVDDVTNRDLDWTVVRVLRLTDGPPTRQYTTGNIKLGYSSVSYGDLSSFLLDCCDRGIYLQMLPKIRT